jgi:hypothetical protein
MKKKRTIPTWATWLVAVLCVGLMCLGANGATITALSDDPPMTNASISQLKTPESDAENIDGTVNGVAVTYSGTNDASTYVSYDRSTQGQLFTTGFYPKGYVMTDFWVKHVLYTTFINNGSYASLSPGNQITIRIVDPAKANTSGFVLLSEVATVTAESTPISVAGGAGTGLWLHVVLDNPVNLAPNTQYGFDLTSPTGGPYFELAGVYTDEYDGGAAYTCAAKGDLNTGTVHIGDRTFVIPFDVPQTFAYKPNPEDGATDVPWDTVLSWKPGIDADTHNLFFGTDFNDVNEATIEFPLGTTYKEGIDVNNYDPGKLEFGTTYYWRIDEVNSPSSPGTNKGQVWSFTIEPVAYKLAADRITVTAISSAKGNDPNNTINESGLDPNTEQHSNGSGSWASSGTDTNDVWIRYDFDKPYKLYEMLVWNYNHTLLWRYGFKDVLIEYSEDGQAWTQLTTVTQFDRASGKPDYVYNNVVPFNGAVAKSVRITALSNWGTYKNSGLSEVRFNYIPVRARKPSPEADSNDVSINTTLSWRTGREAVSHNVYISTSEEAIEDGSAQAHTVAVNSYVPSLNVGQTYYWRVDEVNNAETPSVWQGDIWSFMSQEYITIDDFEDYNDSSGYEIWSTWVDGYGVDENGSQMGHTNSPFAEKVIVEHGRQSAPIYYDNTTTQANYSQVTCTFDSTMNWQVNGADSIRLYYHGVADQAAENLYIALEDSTGKSAKVFAPADALGTTVWTEWVIPYSQFTGVNMTKIKKISIGVGDTPTPLKGSGVVYIDNIGYGHSIAE